jgi:hypothetical protein
MESPRFVIQRKIRNWCLDIKSFKGSPVLLLLFTIGIFLVWLRPSLSDVASLATIIALILTMVSLSHSSLSLRETKNQIEKSNLKSVASVFLSKLESIFESISYRYEAHLAESATGRAAIMEAFLTMDGSHNHYLSVDLLDGYFKFYLRYFEFLLTNREKLGKDFQVHMIAVEHDFILLQNEVRSIVGNLTVLKSTTSQYYSVNDAKNSFEKLMEYHRLQIKNGI